MSKPNSFEGLALEVRQRIYFFAGFPVVKKYYGPKDWKFLPKKFLDLDATLGTKGNPKVSIYGTLCHFEGQDRLSIKYGLRAAYKDATYPYWIHIYEEDIQTHPLLCVNRRLRHELLCLLFDGGLGFHITPIHELPTTSWSVLDVSRICKIVINKNRTSLVRPKTMDYMTSAVVSIHLSDTPRWEINIHEQEHAHVTFDCLNACAPNLREFTLKLRNSTQNTNVCDQVTSFPSAVVALYRLIRSLHHFVTINSEKHLELIRLDWSNSITQVLHRKDFGKICAWGDTVILRMHRLDVGEITEVQEIDVDLLQGHKYSDGNCSDQCLTIGFEGLEDTFFPD